MRKITDHKGNEVNDAIKIEASDNVGAGGAPRHYQITYSSQVHALHFQEGKELSPNGITNEVLLAIVADRLACFQKGPFVCDENQESLGHVKAALAILKQRTEKRRARGVEGTHQV